MVQSVYRQKYIIHKKNCTLLLTKKGRWIKEKRGESQGGSCRGVQVIWHQCSLTSLFLSRMTSEYCVEYHDQNIFLIPHWLWKQANQVHPNAFEWHADDGQWDKQGFLGVDFWNSGQGYQTIFYFCSEPWSVESISVFSIVFCTPSVVIHLQCCNTVQLL